MGECGTSVVLQWAKHRIGIDLVAGSSQRAAAVVAAEIVPKRVGRAGFIVDPAGVEDRTADPQCRKNVDDTVDAECAIEDIQRRTGVTVAVNAGAQRGRVAAERAISNT